MEQHNIEFFNYNQRIEELLGSTTNKYNMIKSTIEQQNII